MGANNGLDGVLTMVAAPSVFFNECEISFKFDWRSEAELPSDINVQVRNNISRPPCVIVLLSVYGGSDILCL